jgi:hypothetical protein
MDRPVERWAKSGVCKFMEFTGEFETHITVGLDNDDQIESLNRWGTARSLKCLHIVLERGATASQPMLTRHGRGRLTDELKKAAALAESLRAAGFPVLRIKIEAAAANPGARQFDAIAFSQPPDRYFEHHIKLMIDPRADLSALAKIAEQHNAHLSRNALSAQSNGYQERFITQRCLSVGRNEARQQLQALLDAIGSQGYPVLKAEEELVVYDSNLALDTGWIR